MAAVVVAYWSAAGWAAGPPSPVPTVESARLAAIASTRTGLLAFGAALGALGTVGVNIFAVRFTARTVALTERGQLTDRYAKAIELVGDPKNADVRVGGIYALEQFSRDSPPNDRATVVEVLSAFVRGHARLTADTAPDVDQLEYDLDVHHDDDTVAPPTAPLSPEHELDPDVQAALTVLARLDRTDVPATPDLRRCHLDGAQLDGAQLAGAVLPGARLGGSQLASADFTSADLRQARLDDAVLIYGCLLISAHLEYATLNGARADGVNLSGAHLSGASLNRALLREAQLPGVQADGASMTSAHLEKATIRGARFTRAHLDEVHLERTQAQRAVFDGANLEDAFFIGAELTLASFAGARLHDADFTAAILRGADFRDAALQGVVFDRADLGDANLSTARNLEQDQIDTAEGNAATRLPADLRHSPSWLSEPAPRAPTGPTGPLPGPTTEIPDFGSGES